MSTLLGLPRIVSTEEDVEELLAAIESPNNGLTFCTGSFGVRADNDLPKMFNRFADKVTGAQDDTTQRAALSVNVFGC